jgi:serine/threonine-protein kinase
MNEAPTSPKHRPSAPGLAALAALGAAHALWTLFQWTQLVAARTGGQPSCGLGGGDGRACTTVWDSELASAVQSLSGLPVAGWGLVWSLVAFALPLAALARRAAAAPERRSESERPSDRPGLWPATVLTAGAGLLVVLGLLVDSILKSQLCNSCAITYAIVCMYAIVCLRQTPLPPAGLLRGAGVAACAGAVAFALLLFPGLRTPKHLTREAQRVLERVAAQSSGSIAQDATPDRVTADRTHGGPSQAEIEADVATMLQQLSPELLQTFSSALDAYATASSLPLRRPRALIGSERAPVRITEFTDALCGHCAELHETIGRLRTMLPLRAFSLEARHFPLDASCNSALGGESTAPVRCVAARALICLEGEPDFLDFAGSLYFNQQKLDEGTVYALAEPIMTRDELTACMRAESTEAKLQSDIAWAVEHDIQGTPLVLLNGREVAAFGPLLYALILTRGDPLHAAFASLPAPQQPSGSRESQDGG